MNTCSDSKHQSNTEEDNEPLFGFKVHINSVEEEYELLFRLKVIISSTEQDARIFYKQPHCSVEPRVA